jgi:hypothetical protein
MEPAAAERPVLDRLLGELSHVLWRQRSVMTEFVYRLDVLQLLLVNRREKWLVLACEEVERAVERIERHQEMHQRLLVEIGAHLGVAPDDSLSELCRKVPSPWDDVFEEHRAAFLVLIAEAEEATRENRDLLGRGLSVVEQLMGRIGEHSGAESRTMSVSYRPPGQPEGPRRPTGAMTLDREV